MKTTEKIYFFLIMIMLGVIPFGIGLLNLSEWGNVLMLPFGLFFIISMSAILFTKDDDKGNSELGNEVCYLALFGNILFGCVLYFYYFFVYELNFFIFESWHIGICVLIAYLLYGIISYYSKSVIGDYKAEVEI